MTHMLASFAPLFSMLGPLLLVAAWFVMRGDRNKRLHFVLLWLGVLLLQVASGWQAGAVDPGSTRRGMAMIFSSTSWFLGPVLAPLIGGQTRALTGVFIGTLMTPLGAVFGLSLALVTGVINPCGG